MMSESEKEQLQRLEDAYRKLWAEHEDLKLRIKAEYAEFKVFCDQVGFQKSTPTSQVSPVQQPQPQPQTVNTPQIKQPAKTKEKTSWEVFVGEKLLSKIGILIVLIGVGIGVKYAIDNELIGSFGKVFSGFLVSVVLGFFAFRFRAKYQPFSAVLASGSVATAYFMTFASYQFYQLIPLGLCFGILFALVLVAIWLSFYYNYSVISHMALLGAYILPPLVSTGQNHISYYLTYLLIINAGLAVVAYLKKWITIHYSIILWTVIVFLYWFSNDFSPEIEAVLAASFLALFFTVLAIGVRITAIRDGLQMSSLQAGLMFGIQVFYYFGIAYALNDRSMGLYLPFSAVPLALQTIFYATIKNKENNELSLEQKIWFAYSLLALVQCLSPTYASYVVLINTVFLAAFLVRKSDALTQNLVQISGFSILLIVLIVSYFFVHPNSLDSKSVSFVLLTVSIIIVSASYFFFLRTQKDFLPVSSVQLLAVLTYVLLVAGIISGVGVYQDYRTAVEESLNKGNSSFNTEFFAYLFAKNRADSAMISASVLVFHVLALGFRYLVLGWKGFHLSTQITVAIVLFFTLAGFSSNISDVDRLSEVPEAWSVFSLAHGLIVLSLVVMGVIVAKTYQKNDWFKMSVVLVALWILSAELVHWSLLGGFGVGYKILLSLLWVAFAVGMIIIGIKKNRAFLRVTAMVILGIAVLKVFVYDISTIGTIYKTLVVIAIGGLLLVGAYYYQLLSKQEAALQNKKDEEASDQSS